ATPYSWTKDTVAPTAVLSGLPLDPSQATSLSVDVTSAGGVVTYKYAVGSSTLDCTASGNYSAETAESTDITANLGGTGAKKLCAVGKDAAGNWQDYASAPTFSWTKIPTITLTVAAAYGSHGAKWNDYVKNNAADIYSATDTACAGTETGYIACLH